MLHVAAQSLQLILTFKLIRHCVMELKAKLGGKASANKTQQGKYISYDLTLLPFQANFHIFI